MGDFRNSMCLIHLVDGNGVNGDREIDRKRRKSNIWTKKKLLIKLMGKDFGKFFFYL